MLHIQIIQVGKTKEQYYKEAEEELSKRLSRYAKVEIVIIDEKKGITDISKTMQIEGVAILKRIPDGNYIIALDRKGDEYSSLEFAEFLKDTMVEGKLTFVIGGPYGLSEEVLNKADKKLSLSKMTFTHQMIRLFLLEQIYRAFTILKGKTYHY